MTAAQYVSKYHTISVGEYKLQQGKMYASTIINTPVDEYLNRLHKNRAGYSHDQRWKLRAGISEFLAEQAPLTESPVYLTGKGYRIGSSITPCEYVDDDMMKEAFLGKASPEVLLPVIQAISYWRGCRVLEGGTPVPSMPALVDMFLGSDCNGFVGNYMSSKYKAQEFRLGHSSPEEDYFYNRHSIRDSAADIRADDIVLLNRVPKSSKGEVAMDWNKKTKKEMEEELSKQRFLIGHIMVISSVGAPGANTVEVMISESATSDVVNGGPRTRPYTLQRMGTYKWKIIGRDREVHSIIKVKRTG